jgi:hypothetical protein
MSGGIEGEPRRGEPTPQPSTPTEQHKPHQEGGNGAPGIPPTLNVNVRAKPPPERLAQGGSESIGVQELLPESEATSTQPTRKRGRPKLSELSEEERTRRWVERHERLFLRKLRKEQRQFEATLSESELRDWKRPTKARLEAYRDVHRKAVIFFNTRSEGSVNDQGLPQKNEKEIR